MEVSVLRIISQARKIAQINGARALSLNGRCPLYLADIQTTRPPPYLTINSRLSVHTIFRQLTSISLRSRRRVFFLQAARGERAWPASISPNIYIWPLQAWNYSYFVMLNQVFQSKLSISILYRSLKDWPEKVLLRKKKNFINLDKHHSPLAQRVVSATQGILVNYFSILQSCLELLLICSWFF